MRVKSRWHQTKRDGNQNKAKSLEEIASALAFSCWRIAGNSVVEIENQGYHTTSSNDRLNIVAEYLAFLLQVSDRLLYEKLTPEQRQTFIPALALSMAHTFADNKTDIEGEGEHQQAFIDLLNQRAESYAQCSFSDETPGFDFLRVFGEQVAVVLDNDNPLWVSQFVAEVDLPIVLKTLKQAVKQLFQAEITEA
ncbi:MAG: hypothetical protein VSS52_000180 [Thiotrichaceae bacterium]|nr:hypothetical protein [Thiotrichaceae bacterium]